eukprot:3601036-Pleurochrysis_carterae.AAC.1
MWERLRLFLELDTKALAKKPQREVLWEQDAWNDLAKSIEKQRRIFPWAVGYGRDSDLWAALGYERTVKHPPPPTSPRPNTRARACVRARTRA